MNFFRIVVTVSLFAAIACAQNVTVINTRDKSRVEPAGHSVGGSGTGGSDSSDLKARFTVENQDQLAPGQRFDYELLITNNKRVPVVIPQSLDWSDVDMGGSSQKYLGASIAISVCCVGKQDGQLTDNIQLYGSDERPSTELTLMPGDSVRILGSAVLPLRYTINDHPIFKGTLKGHVSLTEAFFHRTPTPQHPDAYRTEGRTLMSVTATEEYPIDLTPQR